MPDQNKTSEQDRQLTRLLKLLSRAPGTGMAHQSSNTCDQLVHKGSSFKFPPALLKEAGKKKLVLDDGQFVRISSQGMLELQSRLNPETENPYRRRHREAVTLDSGKDARVVLANTAESPLLRLYRRKDPRGGSYLTSDEFQAGEKLRSDFERGQLQPSVTVTWTAMPANSKRGNDGSSELSEFAMDARKRVAGAVEALGPELSGVALDICCFLKGFERVERERSWPPRSAKLMLKTGLSLLSRHYGFNGSANSGKRQMRHWGKSDFRPTLNANRGSRSGL